MARSVVITTPIPTLEEVGESLGMSKKRQASIIALFRKEVPVDGLSVQRRDRSGVITHKSSTRSSKATAKK